MSVVEDPEPGSIDIDWNASKDVHIKYKTGRPSSLANAIRSPSHSVVEDMTMVEIKQNPHGDGDTDNTDSDNEEVAFDWEDERLRNECKLCDKAFSLFNRKHHCRSCGSVFCNTCCPRRPNFAETRFCDPCYKHITSEPAKPSRRSSQVRVSVVDFTAVAAKDAEISKLKASIKALQSRNNDLTALLDKTKLEVAQLRAAMNRSRSRADTLDDGERVTPHEINLVGFGDLGDIESDEEDESEGKEEE